MSNIEIAMEFSPYSPDIKSCINPRVTEWMQTAKLPETIPYWVSQPIIESSVPKTNSKKVTHTQPNTIMANVELLNVMGDDLMVVNAARVSFAKESNEFSNADEKLIKYLAKHNHNSPFFHPQIQFRIRMPLFVAREWFRHQIGFSRNEVSRRYVNSFPECWIPSVDEVREKDSNKKQGSKETPVQNPQVCVDMMTASINKAISTYESLLIQGVAPEVARAVLPQSMYTEFIETGSLAAYARLYNLRTTPDAQREIQTFAYEIGGILSKKFPVSWDALTASV